MAARGHQTPIQTADRQYRATNKHIRERLFSGK
jgi:hypothetical protein